jgi:hypothetical protein
LELSTLGEDLRVKMAERKICPKWEKKIKEGEERAVSCKCYACDFMRSERRT